jgi:hypothetical protein
MLGYQPHTETSGAFGYTYLLEQFESFGLVPPDAVLLELPPPGLQAARRLATATAVMAATSAFFFTVIPFNFFVVDEPSGRR